MTKTRRACSEGTWGLQPGSSLRRRVTGENGLQDDGGPYVTDGVAGPSEVFIPRCRNQSGPQLTVSCSKSSRGRRATPPARPSHGAQLSAVLTQPAAARDNAGA